MRTSPKKSLLFPLFLVICNLVFVPTQVNAQTISGLTAIPPRLEITVSPGKIVTNTIKVRNESPTEKTIYTSTKDYIVTDNKGTPVQIDENDNTQNRWAAASWVQFSPSRLRLKPGETKSIVLSIVAPDDATPGGHYAMVLHTPSNDATLTQTGAAVETNVGTLLYITVPGAITEDARVSQFSVPGFSEYGPIDFKTTVANFSDIHINPSGIISITNWLGGKTASLELSPTNIFPGTSRDFANTLNKKWLFGRYKAQFMAAYGTSGQALLATAFFWVIPWKLILSLTIIITLVIILIILNKTKKQSGFDSSTPDEPELTTLKKKYKDKS